MSKQKDCRGSNQREESPSQSWGPLGRRGEVACEQCGRAFRVWIRVPVGGDGSMRTGVVPRHKRVGATVTNSVDPSPVDPAPKIET